MRRTIARAIVHIFWLCSVVLGGLALLQMFVNTPLGIVGGVIILVGIVSVLWASANYD